MTNKPDEAACALLGYFLPLKREYLPILEYKVDSLPLKGGISSMKIYERSLKISFILVCFWSCYAIFQIVIQALGHGSDFFIWMYSVLLAILVVCTILIGLDMLRKDHRISSGVVVYVEEYRIHIRKANGKIKKVRVKAAEYGRFHLEQVIEMHQTRCSGLLIAMHSEDKGREVTDEIFEENR
jgi:hypothetical protein